MISRIFKVDTSPECNTMATDLATLFSDTQAPKRHLVQVNDFYKNRKNPFFTFVTREWQKQKAKELQALFFLGHTDDRTFGDFSPKEFAAHFDEVFDSSNDIVARAFPKPFKYQDKNEIKDIYLFGCAAGLANANKNDSYAQRVANELFARGFTKLRVHAIAYEKRHPEESMYVEVIWRPALGDDNTLRGFISAYSIDSQTDFELEKTRREQEEARQKMNTTHKNLQEIERRIKHLHAVAKARREPIVQAVSPLAFLRQAENTFMANETDKERKERIAHDRAYNERQERKKIIALIQPIKDKKENTEQKKLLICFMEALRADYKSSWQQICNTYKEQYKKLITFVGYTRPSQTLELFKQLSQGNIPYQTRSRSFPMSTTIAFDIPEQLLHQIDALHTTLENEIATLHKKSKRACLTFFVNFEIETKTKKRACLAALKKAKTFDDLQKTAMTQLKSHRVTWHFRNTCTHEWGESRVRDLLRQIMENTSEEVMIPRQLKPYPR